MRAGRWVPAARFAAAAVMAVAVAGCVDVHRCHDPVAWRVCDGESAQPGASGAAPAIVALVLPTCANVNAPTVSGVLHISDADGDAQLVKMSLFAGTRIAESELPLDDAGRTGNDWEGTYELAPPVQMRQATTYQVRLKVTDRAGNQSAPLCAAFSIID
jgi:hypothetical protein